MPATVTLLGDETEFSISSDILVARSMLSDLIHETAKLKGSTVTRDIPIDKLTRLMNILHWNVRDGAKLTPLLDQVGAKYVLRWLFPQHDGLVILLIHAILQIHTSVLHID